VGLLLVNVIGVHIMDGGRGCDGGPLYSLKTTEGRDRSKFWLTGDADVGIIIIAIL